MRSNRWVWVGVYLVATAVLAAGVIILVQDQRDSGRSSASAASDLPELAPMPFAAGLTPVGPTTARVGSTLTFETEGYTNDDVRTVELWDGNRRIETQSTNGTKRALLALPALSVGQHAVYARVVDDKGRASLTAPIPVDVVSNGSEPVAPVEVAPDEGETLQALATRLDIGVDRLSVIAAGSATKAPEDVKALALDPTDVIPVGALVSAQPDGDAGLEQAVSPDPVVPKGGGSSSGDLALSAKASDCSVTLSVSGADGSVDLWEGVGSSSGWSRVGTRTGEGTVEVPAVTAGVHLYFASSGSQKTAPIQVTMPPGCSKAVGWTGNAIITDGVLTVTTTLGSGGQWLYLQVDGGTAVRVPATGYLPSVGLHTDIGSLLPPLDGASLDLELWQGTEISDKLLATGHLDAPKGGSIADVLGESRQLELALTNPSDPGAGAPLVNEQDRKLTFTWTAGPRIEAVLYQVLVADVPVTQTKLAPEGILATGVSARDSAGSTGTGTFTINTADIPGRPATGRNVVPSVAPAYAASVADVVGTKITSSTKPAFVTAIGPDTADRLAEPTILVDLPTFGDDVYVRAIGLASDGSGVLSASNTVRVQLPTPQGVKGSSVDFVPRTDFGDTLFSPGHLPVRFFRPCAWVDVSWNGPVTFGKYQQRTPDGPTERIETMSAAYPTDGTYCPSDFPPPPPPAGDDCGVAQFFCDVWEGVKEFGGAILSAAQAVYQFAATALSTVVDTIAGAVANYSGLCQALEEVASGSKKTCGSVLKMATKAAISAVLVAVGVPPVLPDPGLLASVAKGDFASVAVALMEAAGIPCASFKPDPDVATAMDEAAKRSTGTAGVVAAVKDPCLAIATALVATVKNQVLSKAQVAIAQAGGLPYRAVDSSNYSLKLTTSPLGQTSASRVTLRMQPRDDNADANGTTCVVNVRIVAVSSDGKERTIVPTQAIEVPELPAPNRGRWERTILLTSQASNKDLNSGPWHLRVTSPVVTDCRLESVDLAAPPVTLPNYAKDRKKGQPVVEAARPAA